jgi:stalled ribosome alternative rescue factor ArfA
MGKRNPVAQVLRTPTFRPRKTRVNKGKGAYTRKPRHRTARPDGVFFISSFVFFQGTVVPFFRPIRNASSAI